MVLAFVVFGLLMWCRVMVESEVKMYVKKIKNRLKINAEFIEEKLKISQK